MVKRKRKFKSPESESRQVIGRTKGIIKIKEKRGLNKMMGGDKN